MFHDMGWGGMWFGWIFWLVLIGLVLWVAFRSTKTNFNQLPSETPLDILKKRYAKGEINTEEFERMKNKLT